MKRRNFLTLFPIAGFAAAFGIKLKAEPELKNDPYPYAGEPVSGGIMGIRINGQDYSVGPGKDIDYVNFN